MPEALLGPQKVIYVSDFSRNEICVSGYLRADQLPQQDGQVANAGAGALK
jgi:hypothetical protein